MPGREKQEARCGFFGKKPFLYTPKQHNDNIKQQAMTIHPIPDNACRPLTAEETARLERQNCTATDWGALRVHPDCDLRYVQAVHFSGANRIGRFRKTFTLPGGVQRHAGIYRATLHETCIGDDCLIDNIHGYVAHYDIGPETVILNTDTIATTQESTFGLGTEICVLSEAGGREIVLHDRLSAQEAYLQAMYRHNAALGRRLRELALARADSLRGSRGCIGRNGYIARCGSLTNIRTGPYCHIEGAVRLENGTICSHEAARTFVGEQVIARDFVFQSGCRVTDGAQLTRCHVGEATAIGQGFSATDTFFASNCQAGNGEACAVFAGPYTVSHHKSTLLIGGMFSFMNAGSGTNQSNHAYKLGPLHHGILERGCKTASCSHILWPARIGAFSLLMGHFAAHADTRPFPFSYILEREGAGWLIPGIALRNAGTLRDIRKWPERDARPAHAPRLDHITFDAYSPYTMERVMQAQALLAEMEAGWPAGTDETVWQGLRVKRKAVADGLKLYRMAADRFVGEQLLKRLQKLDDGTAGTLQAALCPAEEAAGDWCDAGGLLAPRSEMAHIEQGLTTGRIASTEELHAAFRRLHERYGEMAWAWTWQQIRQTYPHAGGQDLHTAVCLPILRKWEAAATRLNEHIMADARKEFSATARIGFGIDGDDSEAQADFLSVRGRAEENSLIRTLEAEQAAIRATARHWTERLSHPGSPA